MTMFILSGIFINKSTNKFMIIFTFEMDDYSRYLCTTALLVINETCIQT